MINNLLDVSVVVCTKNSVGTIKECLESIIVNNPKEIIVVDAHSKDGTSEIAKPYATKIVEDPGLGLAVARNYGIEQATQKYICNVGSDNVLPPGTLKEMIEYLKKNNFAGVSAQTLIKDPAKSYFSLAMNFYKKARFYPGPRQVIGTPHLFVTEVLKKNNFDSSMSWSDDSDLCSRLSKMGQKFGVSDAIVYEIGSENMKSIKYRWNGYGLSDYEYYKKYSKEWGLKRKIKSFLHPFTAEFLGPLKSRMLKIDEKIKVAPFLVIITTLRYFSWLKYAVIKNKKT